jgi:uncharacterized protein YbjT (DUF2867 family)
MKIVVIGGTGLIGSRVVDLLIAGGHDATPASLSTGTNVLTGEGVDDAVAGAEVLLDVSNSPSFADEDVMNFFTTSTRNLIAAATASGVDHYVALSVVGCDRLPHSGYLRAKVAQEKLISESGVPFTVVRATQFFEFAMGIADSATLGDQVHLPRAYFQPMAADDVAAAVARASLNRPVDGVVEVAGPERVRMSDFVAGVLERTGDHRTVVADAKAKYFGTTLTDKSLVPEHAAWVSSTTYADWATAHGCRLGNRARSVTGSAQCTDAQFYRSVLPFRSTAQFPACACWPGRSPAPAPRIK